jgi:hypothetical protein
MHAKAAKTRVMRVKGRRKSTVVMSRQGAEKKKGNQKGYSYSGLSVELRKKTAADRSRGAHSDPRHQESFFAVHVQLCPACGDMAHPQEQASKPIKQPGI